jgi:hypothetical protein
MRLKQLILMLSSDIDGEVVNAARAIGKQLKKEGMDWHGLAARLDVTPKKFDEEERTTTTGSHISTEDLHMMTILTHPNNFSKLTLAEQGFIRDMKSRIERYSTQTFITPKQRNWLAAIYKKVHNR